MKLTITIIQIVISLLLAGAILMQSRGTGIGTTFGGGSEQYRSKRGIEQLLYKATQYLIVAFFIASLLNVLIK